MRRRLSRLARWPVGARLLVSALVLSAVLLATAGLILSAAHRRNLERGFDERLHIYLKELAADLASPNDSARSDFGSIGEPRFELPLSGWYWQVVQIDAAPGFRRFSRSSTGLPFRSLAELGVPASIGERREATIAGPDDRSLRVVERVIELDEEGRFRITVAGNREEVDADIRRFTLMLWSVFLALGALLAASTLVQVRFGLRPLGELRSEVAAVRRGEAERVAGAYPDDLAPLSAELNQLIDANRGIVDRARMQVGNLAHALKTPLSVLLNEASGQDGPLAAQVREQADIINRHLTHYLNRARAAASAASAGALGLSCEVGPVCADLARLFERLSRERNLAITVAGDMAAKVRCERQDLEEMLGNLIDNACKWAASRVEIAITMEPGDPAPLTLIRVTDDGPGLAPPARAAALRRGARLDETKPGSGLGLSIVAELAGLYGGSLRLEEALGGGLLAELRLPAV